ncbi:MAG: response regulator transcription factor [Flavobacteriales bacterium]|nr:MAG: response regulator transcription factor [Flavobacteriales bacterium]
MPIRVSVIEDDAILRDAMADAIGDDPAMQVVGLHPTGESFLAQLEAEAPDVAIMDINLPGFSGIEAVRRAKAKRPAAQFLMCTVQDDDDHLFEALCAGATGYLVKDADPQQVIAAVKDLHGGGSPMSAGIARRVIHALQRQRSPSPEIMRLTDREREVLDQLAQGYRYKEIAARLQVSMDTVRTHIRNLYEKLQVSSRTDALNKLYPR